VQRSQESGLPFPDPEFLQGKAHEGFLKDVPGPVAIGQENLPRFQAHSSRFESLVEQAKVGGELSAPMPQLQSPGFGASQREVRAGEIPNASTLGDRGERSAEAPDDGADILRPGALGLPGAEFTGRQGQLFDQERFAGALAGALLLPVAPRIFGRGVPHQNLSPFCQAPWAGEESFGTAT